MDFTVKFDADHLIRALEDVRRKVVEPRGMLESVGETLLRINRDRHAQGLAPDGTIWKPLAPGTIGSEIWKKQSARNRSANSKRGPMMSLKAAQDVRANRKALFSTGEMLLNNFQYQVRGDTLHLGFSIDRAKWHHDGTKPYTITPKKAKALSFGGIAVKRVHHPGLPARPLIGFPDSDQHAAADAVEDYLLQALRQARP